MPLYNVLEGLATDSRLEAVRALLATIEANTAALGNDEGGIVAAITDLRDAINAVEAASNADRDATVTRLDTAIARLDDLISNTASLELNTDDLEARQQATTDAVDALRTSLEAAEAASDTRDDTTHTHLATITARLDSLLSTLGDDEAGVRAELVAARDAITTALAAHEAARATDADTAQTRLDLLSTEATLAALRADLAGRDLATDATLQAISDALDGLQASLGDDEAGIVTAITSLRDALNAAEAASNADRDTNIARLDTLISRVAERTRPADIQSVTLVRHLRTREGNGFMAGSGKLEATLTSSNLRFLLTNPSGSGRVLNVYRVVPTMTANSAIYADLIANPTGNLPTTARAVTNQYLGHPTTSPAEFRADVGGSAFTGGSNLGQSLLVSREAVGAQDILFTLAPGQSLGIQIMGAPSGTYNLNISFFEEALA